ncbi:hypothetical protein AVEN_39414-1 [Araneus ventricosus]|uniref:C2H2-type domain-containing protein n=1 Tax=Araneus ventricosus TaxID=182803 RepID=A0A4Y1ZTL5_ARAVE|nr:hypothetical protein AVEN_39414-1 [Araneus ventricosus]
MDRTPPCAPVVNSKRRSLPPDCPKLSQRKFILEKDGWKTVPMRKSPPPKPKVESKIEVPLPISFVRPSDSKPKLLSVVVKPDPTLESSRKSDAPALPTNNSKPATRQAPTDSGKPVKAKVVSPPSGSSQQPSTSIAPPSAELVTKPPCRQPAAIITDGSLRCQFCELQLPNRKALRVHLIQVHKLQEQRRERQSSPTPELNSAPTSPDMDSTTPRYDTYDFSTHKSCHSCFTAHHGGGHLWAYRSPIGWKETDLHILFPINEKLVCTEEGCSTPFKTNDWHSTKNSLTRHLRTKHRILIKRSVYWCFICQARIFRHPAEHECLQDCIVATDQSSGSFRCDICNFDCPTQLGLNNHKKMHRRKDAEESMPKRSIPRPKKRRRNNKRRSRQQSPEANPSGDEGAIDDP